jgi:predicted HNH restriction endonuclease
MAFSGGDWDKYALPLRNLKPSDILLMYHNGLGIVAVGRVVEVWDGQSHSAKLIYTKFDYAEYRIRVDWYIDLRANPIDPRSEFGYVPRGFLKPIVKDKATVADLVTRIEMQTVFRSADELNVRTDLQEGEGRTVSVDEHERNPIARRQCIEHWGAICQVCGFRFAVLYGPLGEGYIHVHHLAPIGMTAGPRPVDPVNDLRPVCPNCHAIIHKKHPPYSIEDVIEFIDKQKHSRG